MESDGLAAEASEPAVEQPTIGGLYTGLASLAQSVEGLLTACETMAVRLDGIEERLARIEAWVQPWNRGAGLK